MPIHVLQLGPYPPPEGGISRNMLAIRERLVDGGHTSTIIATSRSSSKTPDDNVHRPRSAVELLALLHRIPFDVLHLHVGGNVSRRVLGLALACSVAARRRCVLTIHSGAFPESEVAKKASRTSLAGAVFRNYSRLIAVNDEISEVFRRSGADASKVIKISPFSFSDHYPDVELPPNMEEFIGEHSPLFLSVGGLERDYDPLLQIRAMEDLITHLPDAGLIMAGGGSMRSDVEGALKVSSARTSILAPGNIEHALTIALLQRVDAVLRTTLFDGDAISVREAIQLGTPVIATDTGTRPDGTILIPIGDRTALVDRMLDIPKNKSRRVMIPDHSNIDAVIELYLELVQC